MSSYLPNLEGDDPVQLVALVVGKSLVKDILYIPIPNHNSFKAMKINFVTCKPSASFCCANTLITLNKAERVEKMPLC
jgi:hypothetical protein